MFFFLKYIFYAIAVLAVLAAGLLAYLTWFQPPFYFPKPTGHYAVGVREYHWVDTTRKEIYSDDPVHPNRELMVKIWYPAAGQPPAKPSTPYAPYLVEYFKSHQKKYWFLLGFARPLYSYAQLEAVIAQDVPHYPVILFSHGFGLTRDSNTAQCEELASHGYIVVGVSHTYSSCIVQFPDGRLVDGLTSMAKRLGGKALTEDSRLLEQEIEIWATDVRFVLDQLEQFDRDRTSPFYQRIDKENIGIFGHSLGGVTAAQMCHRDARVKAGVDLDGLLYGPAMTQKLAKPFMFMLKDDLNMFERPWTQDDVKQFDIYSPGAEDMFKSRYASASRQLAQSGGQQAYTAIVRGAKHMAFCDYVLLKHASILSRVLRSLHKPGDLGTGSINGFRATEIVNTYLVSFFNKYLKGQPSELFDGGERSRYPEVVTKQWEEKIFKKGR